MYIICKSVFLLRRSISGAFPRFLSISKKFLIFCFFNLGSGLFADVEHSFFFLWDSFDEVFKEKNTLLNGEKISYPKITLFEDCYYLFRSDGANFTIIDPAQSSNSSYSESQLFGNSIQGENQYILFKPSNKTPRELIYKNIDSSSVLFGEISIIDHIDLGLFSLTQNEKSKNFGSAIDFISDNEFIVTDPSYHENSGMASKITINPDLNHDHNFQIISNNKYNFGSSLSADINSSLILLGSPNANSMRGSVSLYSHAQNSFPFITQIQGHNVGELFGWASSISGRKIAVSSVSPISKTGGFVQIFDSLNANRQHILQPSITGYNNEFGYDLNFYNDHLIVGAPGESDLIRNNSGSAYLYHFNENSYVPSLTRKLIANDRQDGDRFGDSVSLNENYAFVSAPFSLADQNSSGVGSFYIFKSNNSDENFLEITKFNSPLKALDQRFALDLESTDNTVFVSSASSEYMGKVFVYRRHDINLKCRVTIWPQGGIDSLLEEISETNSSELEINYHFIKGFSEFENESTVLEIGEIKSSNNAVDFHNFHFVSGENDNNFFKLDANGVLYSDPTLLSHLNSLGFGNTKSVHNYDLWITASKWIYSQTLDLNESNVSLPSLAKINLSTHNGVLVAGVPEFNDYGVVQVFKNPSWDNIYQESLLNLPPFFEDNNMTQIVRTEDHSLICFDFNATHPHPFVYDLHWDINSSNAKGFYEINNSTGEFKFEPERDFYGTAYFTVSVKGFLGESIHHFVVELNATNDPPLFSDFVTNDDASPNELVSGTVREEFSYKFNVYDPDNEDLLLNVVQGVLPPGLELNNFNLEGIPTEEGEFIFDLNLSDESNESNGFLVKSFSLKVFPENNALNIEFLGQEITNPTLTLELNENFSLIEWEDKISSLKVTDPENGLIRMSKIIEPTNGYLATEDQFLGSKSIKYFPKINFFGQDTFALRFSDNHPGRAKFVDLYFQIDIAQINSPPVIVSQYPEDVVYESNGIWRHTFDVVDDDLGDYPTLSIENLPDWLFFDGVRTIYGKPTAADYREEPETYFVKIEDQNGGVFEKSYQVKVNPINTPPNIFYNGEKSSRIRKFVSEDSELHSLVSFTATDPDGGLGALLWNVSENPSNGIISIIESNTSAISLSYKSESNFSGNDSFKIIVFEEDYPQSFNEIEIEYIVSARPDPPVFVSLPLANQGVVINKLWTFDIVAYDPDENDFLELDINSSSNWLIHERTNENTWTLQAFPRSGNVGEQIRLDLNLSDGEFWTTHSFALKAIDYNSSFTEFEPRTYQVLEDTTWFSADSLSVQTHDEINVSWSILENARNGIFSFENVENGLIENLKFIPNQNFYGNDKVILEVSDGYVFRNIEFNFDVIPIPDGPSFINFPQSLVESEDETFDILIEYEDGDGVDSTYFTILDMPNWLQVEIINQDKYSRTYRLHGTAQVDDIGSHEISAKIQSLTELNEIDFEVVKDFIIQVNYLNKPPVPSTLNLSAELFEDTPKTWIDFISATDLETPSNLLTWSIVKPDLPNHGNASISPDGRVMSYYPDSNFSGSDSFKIGVADLGGDLDSLPRKTLINVSVNVSSIDDKPFFASSPTTKVDGEFIWTDEEHYSYEVKVLDSDWDWQGYPSIELSSSLPKWVKWENLGKGNALLSGLPSWRDEGDYPFTIIATSGADKIRQDFVLEIIVNDYPPQVFDLDGNEIEQLQIFTVEDDHRGEVTEAVSNLRVFNPDYESGDTLSWRVIDTFIKGEIPRTFSSAMDGEAAMINGFNYLLANDFNGIDRFTLVADEGDRVTRIPVSVHVKSVQDPPKFVEANPLVVHALTDKIWEYEISATDPDAQLINFKLLSPSGYAKWLSIKSTEKSKELSSVTLHGRLPLNHGSRTYTIVATDPSGRFDLLDLKIVETFEN